MLTTAIKTSIITPNACTLIELLDDAVTNMPDGSILAITSKVVSLCEGAVVPIGAVDKEDLIRQEADYYLPRDESLYGINFSVLRNTLIASAGIDESNADGAYILWPRDPQATANQVREYLVQRFGHQNLGVIITDSTCRPMRRGVTGIAIGFSGLKPFRSYVGQPDLFGRPFKAAHADIVGGLAAAAVLVMGEGAESTPIVLLQDVAVAEFVHRDPNNDELDYMRLTLESDLFAPFFKKVNWQSDKRSKTS